MTGLSRASGGSGESKERAGAQCPIEALDILARRDLNQLPVMSGGVLQGLLRREDVVKWMALFGGDDAQTGRAQPRQLSARR